MGDQGDAYGQGVKNAQDTVGLVQTIVNLFSGLFTSQRKKRKDKQGPRERLGEWVLEAFDSQGRRLRPVLRVGAFKDHLNRHAGKFKPSGKCKSSLAWTYLLYALDIRPGGGVLEWKFLTKAARQKDFDFDSLEIDGEVLCYIINLYRLYSKSASSSSVLDGIETLFMMPFGNLYLQMKDSQAVASFEPGTPKELSTLRRPFTTSSNVLKGRDLQFSNESGVSSHEKAITEGFSDDRLRLPGPKEPLDERAVALTSCLKILLRQTTLNKTYLLTPSWIEEVSRIKRRVTTNGCGDLILLLKNSEDIKEELFRVNRVWEGIVESFMTEKTMDKEDSYHLPWTRKGVLPYYASIPVSGNTIDHYIFDKLPDVLEQYKKQPSGFWRHSLSTLSPRILARLLQIPEKIEDVSVIVLEFTPGHELWKPTCELRG
ncbi:hypothetical protein MMC10_004641 [Thelotrema lepadinum]|nr:hypothetical protein [Thelotrema lepadinum]